jgi:hypothetical protein
MVEIDKDKVIEMGMLLFAALIIEIICIAIWYYRGQTFEAFDVAILMLAAGIMFLPIIYAKYMFGIRIP